MQDITMTHPKFAAAKDLYAIREDKQGENPSGP